MTWYWALAIPVAIMCTGLPAFAQDPPGGQSSVAKADANAVKSGDALQAEHSLGNWGGLWTRLTDDGIDLRPSYLAEIAGVVSGGKRHGIDYAHQLKLRADIDLETLAGWKGWSLHGSLLERAGRNASADYLGDDLDQVQEIYGATDHAVAHLGYFYLEHVSGDEVSVDAKAGRLPVGLDFAASPLYCGFLSLGLCPEPRGLTINGSFSTDPSSTWGARVKVAPKGFYLMGGIYQVRPRYGGPSGFDWGFSNTSGAVVPVELGWTPQTGSGQLQGHYKLGIAYDTSDYPDLLSGRSKHHHRLSYYALFDQMLVRTGRNGTDGLILLGGWSHADRATSIFRDFAFVGLAANGIVHSRPHDSIQVLVTRGWVSHRLTEAQQLADASGQPLPTGFPPAPGGFGPVPTAPGIQTDETIYEVNYKLHAADGVILTPDLQYVEHPGATRSIPDGVVLGGRIELDF